MAKRKQSARPKRAGRPRVKSSGPKRSATNRRTTRRASSRRRPAPAEARAAKRSKTKVRRTIKRAAARRTPKVKIRRSAPKRSVKQTPGPTRPRSESQATARPAPRRRAPRPAAPLPTPESAGPVRLHAAKPALDRDRRRLSDDERGTAAAPADDRLLASVKSGGDELKHLLERHTGSSPALTAGDLDANWGDAYAVGDEAPGGDNPTPDQDRVDDIGKALGVNYDEGEELIGAEKIEERDRHRWELDPASSDDWPHDRD